MCLILFNILLFVFLCGNYYKVYLIQLGKASRIQQKTFLVYLRFLVFINMNISISYIGKVKSTPPTLLTLDVL